MINRDKLYNILDRLVDSYAEDDTDILQDELSNISTAFRDELGIISKDATYEREEINEDGEESDDDFEDDVDD